MAIGCSHGIDPTYHHAVAFPGYSDTIHRVARLTKTVSNVTQRYTDVKTVTHNITNQILYTYLSRKGCGSTTNELAHRIAYTWKITPESAVLTAPETSSDVYFDFPAHHSSFLKSISTIDRVFYYILMSFYLYSLVRSSRQ